MIVNAARAARAACAACPAACNSTAQSCTKRSGLAHRDSVYLANAFSWGKSMYVLLPRSLSGKLRPISTVSVDFEEVDHKDKAVKSQMQP